MSPSAMSKSVTFDMPEFGSRGSSEIAPVGTAALLVYESQSTVDLGSGKDLLALALADDMLDERV